MIMTNYQPLTMERNDSTERHILEFTMKEKDLGVIISHNLKLDKQVRYAVAKARTDLSTLRRTLKFWTPNIFRTVHIT